MNSSVFVLEDKSAAQRMVSALRQAGFADEQLWLVAPGDVPLEQMSEEVIKETTDAGPAMSRGVALGGTLGLVGGLLAVSFPPAGVVLGGGAVLMSAAAGASFGAFSSSLVGASVPEPLRREFQDELDQGKVLLEVQLGDDAQQGLLDAVVAEYSPRPLLH